MIKFLLWIFTRLPLSLGRSIGHLVGTILWLLQTRMAQTTLENIELCLPELLPAQQKLLAKRSLQESSKLAFEVTHVWQHTPQWSLKQFIGHQGKHLLDSALADSKPTIVLVPHLGNWEILAPFLAAQKPITALYLPPKKAAHDRFIIQSREKANIQMAPANTKGVSLLLKAVRTGGFIGILPDQEPDIDGGEFAPFFNIPALTMTLVHKLTQRGNCHIVMGYAKRVNGGFEAIFREPHNDIYSTDTAISLSGLNKSIEACIREVPEQYLWEYKRFKQHPSGKKKIYYKKKHR